ncbi:MAG: hypothetical protein JNL83_02330 [Myxococcales bacterium]|nr:hypothetical protein [Myxococcales bacterium]
MRILASFVLAAVSALPAVADTKKQPDVKAPAVTSADDWESPVVSKQTSVLKFGGDEWDFRVTLKNRGKAKTSGKDLAAKITATAGSATLLSTTSTVRPGALSPGATYQYAFKVKPPLKSDAKVVKIVFDAGDGLKAVQEFSISR